MPHAVFIRRCLALARSGQGETGINPLVGAVLVRDGKIIAEAFHAGFGNPHAERALLEAHGNVEPGDVLYVNLEPCCHADKKTPPCAQYIVERGIKNVVVGMTDPNPKVSGKGIAFLREAAVEVVSPVIPDECRRLNRGFVSLMTKGRPWITLKQARSVEGKVANPDGSPLKITSGEQDRWAHAFLRGRHDAILVGVGTILSDNPQLNVRYMDDPPEVFRIVLDAGLRIPLDARVVDPPLAERTIIIREETKETDPSASSSGPRGESGETEEKEKMLLRRGVRIVLCPYRNNVFDWTRLWLELTSPNGDYHGIMSILVEGGRGTWETFRRAGLVDEEVTLVGS